VITAAPDRHIGFWLYLSSASAAGSSPVLEAWVATAYSSHKIITYDPMVNGYTARDRWVYIDTPLTGSPSARSRGPFKNQGACIAAIVAAAH